MTSSYPSWSWPIRLSVGTLALLLVLGVAFRGSDGVSGLFYSDSTRGQLAADLTVNIGVYDPKGAFNETPSAIHHAFIQWHTYKLGSLAAHLDEAKALNRWPMITVEPFPDTAAGLTREALLADVVAGRYDPHIIRVCQDLGTSGQPAFIRWAQEMENVTGRYPWATPDGGAYIAAYRHFVDLCRPLIPAAFFVWSPAGDRGVESYWPGPEYADYVGVSVFGFPEYDQENYGKVRSFEEILGEKYDRVRGFQRPIMVAEMGVTGDPSHQKRWLAEGMKAISKFEQLKTLVYFNSVDSPEAWGAEYEVPDWTIDPNLLRKESD